MWRIWAKALGEKSGNSDGEADLVAIVRTAFIAQAIITNIFIIVGNCLNVYFKLTGH
jgi:hypothetical protein